MQGERREVDGRGENRKGGETRTGERRRGQAGKEPVRKIKLYWEIRETRESRVCCAQKLGILLSCNQNSRSSKRLE